MARCSQCGEKVPALSSTLGFCVSCLKGGKGETRMALERLHRRLREEEDLPPEPPRAEGAPVCFSCSRQCQPAPGQVGYCGLRENRGGQLEHRAGIPSCGVLQYFFDPLPTNCVASWVCPVLEANGRGKRNLAVFYGACTLNCLFCQNWHYRELTRRLEPQVSAAALAGKVDGRTACICFFGGDPAPQMPHALHTIRRALERKPDLRICWETSGNLSPRFLGRALEWSRVSGGTLKFDFKAIDRNLYFALTGGDNRAMLDNFAAAADYSRREGVTLAVASTPLVTGYIDREEIYDIASFIARHDPWTPFSLLGFHPQYRMSDLPLMRWEEAQACYEAAREAGLYRVHLANRPLFA